LDLSAKHTYADLKDYIHSGKLPVADLTREYLNRAGKDKLNAFLEVFTESALKKAAEVDEKIAQGKAGKLAGMIVGLKDNIVYKGHKVSASSKMLENYTAIYNATVVERLLAEDAIIIGRLNCDEFAMGSSNENSAFGPVKNPLNAAMVPGGSSGGSAAAVAAGYCMVALGSDTGGSIRQPASFTGTIGYKPTYGRVSRYGLIAYASSFDQIGPIANSVDDVASIMEVISGVDEHDSTMLQEAAPVFSNVQTKDKYIFTLLSDCVEAEGVDPEIRDYMLSLAAKLQDAGHKVVRSDFGNLKYLVPTYYVLTTAEASSNLSRFDGVHYGYRSGNATDVESTYRLSRSEGFGAEVKRRIMLGTFVLSSGYYDAYFEKGTKVRRMIRNRMNELFAQSDFLLLPTAPVTAFPFGEKSANPIAMYLQDIFTVKANLSGNPAVSLPLGQHSNGMPFGVQVIGNLGDDAGLLSCSAGLIDLFK
jgi:aspartyl-tRNA(Asn)/glutamyl-tRNA(Gln) amidotransferase subunit A